MEVTWERVSKDGLYPVTCCGIQTESIEEEAGVEVIGVMVFDETGVLKLFFSGVEEGFMVGLGLILIYLGRGGGGGGGGGGRMMVIAMVVV